MKKTLVIALAMVFVLSATGAAFAAANPFVDVPANHWSYAAVSQLAKAGIIDGYNDGTFRGDRSMTRYEMAQVVAKAMAREDKADAQQKAMIDKLAVEYASELNNLGVRVTKLEQNQNPLKFGGEVYVRYQSKDAEEGPSKVGGQWRLRLNANANIDDQTTATLRFTSQPKKAGIYKYNSSSMMDFGDSEANNGRDNTFRFDRMYLTRNVGAVKVLVGAQPFAFGANNLAVDSTQYSFDGITLAGKSGVVNMGLVWGRFQSQVDVAAFVANSQWGKLSYGLGYATLKDNSTGDSLDVDLANGTTKTVGLSDKYLAKYIDVNASYLFDKKISLGGEYLKNRSNDFDSVLGHNKSSWLIKAVYGDQALKKAGDSNLTATYLKLGNNAITRWSSSDYLIKAGTYSDAVVGMSDEKAWIIAYNYAISPNLTTQLMYEKVSDDGANLTNAEGDLGYKLWRIGVTAKF